MTEIEWVINIHIVIVNDNHNAMVNGNGNAMAT